MTQPKTQFYVRTRSATPAGSRGVGKVVAEPSGVYLDRSKKLIQQWSRHHAELLEDTPLPMAVFTARGVVAFWNSRAETVFGYKKEEVTGQPMPGLDERGQEEIVFLLQHGFNGDRVEQKSMNCSRKGGALMTISVTATPLHAADGSLFGVLCFLEDVSRVIHLEEQLRNSRSLSRIAGKMAKLGAWNIVIPPEHQMIFPGMSRKLPAILNRYPFLENILEAYLPEDRERLAEAFAVCLEEGTSFDVTARIRQTSGQIVTVRSTGEVVKDAYGNVKGIQGGMQDITRMAETESKLALQGAALNAVENMVVITNVHGHIEWANPSYCRITGYSMDEAEGSTLWELRHENAHPAGIFDRMWITILGGKVWHGEVISRTKNGAQLVEQVTLSPICSDGDKVTHFVAVKQEVTEKKKIEQQVLRAQRTDSIGALAGGIAHDLNNVLAPILMGLELLRLDERDSARGQMIEGLMASARRGSDLVKQILTFARGGSEGQQRMPLDLRMPLRELQRIVERTFPKSIRSHFNAADDLWMALAEPTQMYQIMLNLCMNARDAMREGGEIHVSLQNCVLDLHYAAERAGLKAGPHVLLEVRDTGTGIAKEHWDKLFDPFFTTKPQGEGTGLGLATLQQIVNKHGGRVHFDSEPGKGTVFRVYLPVEESVVARQKEAAESKPMLRGNGQRILLVDDEDPVRLMAQEVLRRFGYRVFSSNRGEVGLHEFEENPAGFDILLVDMDMPKMNGPQVIRAVRRLRPSLPILGCSGHAKPEMIEAAELAGMHDFLPKPFSTEQLLRKVHELLNDR